MCPSHCNLTPVSLVHFPIIWHLSLLVVVVSSMVEGRDLAMMVNSVTVLWMCPLSARTSVFLQKWIVCTCVLVFRNRQYTWCFTRCRRVFIMLIYFCGARPTNFPTRTMTIIPRSVKVGECNPHAMIIISHSVKGGECNIYVHSHDILISWMGWLTMKRMWDCWDKVELFTTTSKVMERLRACGTTWVSAFGSQRFNIWTTL